MKGREEKVKTFKSFYDKILRKRIKDDWFEEVEDIAGIRLVCLYRSDLKKIGTLISQNLAVVKSDTTRTRTENPFGYASDHYIIRLPKEYKGARYDRIKDLKCEIQVRTILMDAWAAVSHHLVYKKEIDLPRELRLDFNSLAGLFYVADTHFELFKEGIESAREKLMKSVRQDKFNLEQEINFDSLSAYMKWKFPARKRFDTSIVSELRKEGYMKISQLDNRFNIASPILKEYEKATFNLEEWGERFALSGLIRACLDLTDDKYFEKRKKKVGMPSVVFQRIEEFRSMLR